MAVGLGGTFAPWLARPSLSGVAATGAVDPSILADITGVGRGLVSFVLVLLFGGAVVYRHEEFVGRAIDASMDRPLVSAVYGLLAYGFVVFFGGYAASQIARIGVAVAALSTVGLALVAGVALTLSGLGYAVVGGRLVEVRGQRRPWPGLVAGAALSGLAWPFLPVLEAFAVWIAVAAVGIGGPTRNWFHDSRAAESELDR